MLWYAKRFEQKCLLNREEFQKLQCQIKKKTLSEM